MANNMTYLPGDTPVTIFSNETTSLANGSTISTGFIDTEGFSAYKVTIRYDDISSLLTFTQVYKLSDGGTESTLSLPLSVVNSDGDFTSFSASIFERYLKLEITNSTGVSVSNFKFQVQLLPITSNLASTLTLANNPVNQSQALLTQSVLIGKDPFGVFQNSQVNQAGALLTSDFGTEVARELYSGYTINTKFGRNPDIDTGTTPEDIYNGGSTYTGFNATANENISVTSSDNDDRGSLVSSGTATGGSDTTLIDTGATFVTDGVAVGDVVLNDTQGIHGVITSVDSETQVTVFQMVDGISADISNASGDSYRIATSIDTGAAVLRLSSILDEDYVEQAPVYVILNGTTTVTTTGVNAMRCATGRVVISGSSGRNEGELTVTQAVTTANVFCIIPTFGSTTVGCFTVPAGKDCIIKRVLCSIVRINGSPGSATINLNVRRFGQSFTAERVYELQTGAPVVDEIVGGIALPPGTDIKGTVEDVSDNNTVAQINIEYFFIDRS